MFQIPIQLDGAPVMLKFRDCSFDDIVLPASKIDNRRDELSRNKAEIEKMQVRRDAGEEIDALRLVRLKDTAAQLGGEMMAQVVTLAQNIQEPTDLAKRAGALLRDEKNGPAFIGAIMEFLNHVTLGGERGKNLSGEPS